MKKSPLRTIRIARGMTGDDVEEVAVIDKSRLCEIEQGNIVPTDAEINRLSIAFKLDPFEIMNAVTEGLQFDEERKEIVPEITLSTLKCNRCGYIWPPRKTTLPYACPRCGSKYWNKPRKRNIKWRPL